MLELRLDDFYLRLSCYGWQNSKMAPNDPCLCVWAGPENEMSFLLLGYIICQKGFCWYQLTKLVDLKVEK